MTEAIDDNTARPTWVEFRWYVGGHAFYFLAMGIQNVIYPYLVTFVLLLPADLVGVAQMFTMLPMFGLVLFGGLTADRAELRMHLIRLQFLAALPMLMLAVLIMAQLLTFPLMMLCSIATGCVSAFVMPARDSLLSRVAYRSPNGDIQQAVTIITAIQFGAQLVGIIIGSTAPRYGTGLIALSVVFCYLLAAFCTTNLRPAPPSVRERSQRLEAVSQPGWRKNIRDIQEGISIVWNSKRMLPVVLQIFFGGLFLMGVFSVHLQLLIRDTYERGIGDYSAIMMAFMIGITSTTTILSGVARRIVHQGRLMMLSFGSGVFVMAVIYFEPPFWFLYVLLFFWGSTSGISMSISRSIIQEAANDSHRARIMSVFQLGFLGGAPIGSLLMGLATKSLGPINAALVPLFGIGAVWLLLFFLTDLWQLRRIPRAA
ncbi:MAG: MFS transporter [Alphaproteobacteria bacterium]|nr:MAG: MFS transporter [Alphaproteobacteria bacterium]